MKNKILSDNENVNYYISRCYNREFTLNSATMNFIDYFINLGDDKNTAETKVTDLSTEVAAYLYAYVLGNKIPLINAINNSTLPFMDVDAKTFLINELTNQ